MDNDGDQDLFITNSFAATQLVSFFTSIMVMVLFQETAQMQLCLTFPGRMVVHLEIMIMMVLKIWLLLPAGSIILTALIFYFITIPMQIVGVLLHYKELSATELQ